MAKQYGCFEKWAKKGLVTGLTAMLALAVSLPRSAVSCRLGRRGRAVRSAFPRPPEFCCLVKNTNFLPVRA